MNPRSVTATLLKYGMKLSAGSRSVGGTGNGICWTSQFIRSVDE